jgi:hypothetical protein
MFGCAHSPSCLQGSITYARGPNSEEGLIIDGFSAPGIQIDNTYMLCHGRGNKSKVFNVFTHAGSSAQLQQYMQVSPGIVSMASISVGGDPDKLEKIIFQVASAVMLFLLDQESDGLGLGLCSCQTALTIAHTKLQLQQFGHA